MNLNDIILPILRLLDPEVAHEITIRMLKNGLYFAPDTGDEPLLETRVWNKCFSNPLGVAAGFDKDAQCYNAMIRLGMGFAEVGSITPKSQSGNPRPRVFRLPKDKGIINRYGFNSKGIENAKKNLGGKRYGIVGVNLGKNKNSKNATSDFLLGVEHLAPFADYLVINISSPNTFGLRSLQEQQNILPLLKATQKKCRQVCKTPPPLLVKLSPDLDIMALEKTVLTLKENKVNGIIVSNTTLSRPKTLKTKEVQEGGLSGKPLFDLSTKVLRDVYKLTDGTIPLIGVGGIFSGKDAYEKIRSGASLVQLYSALTYGGAGMIAKIKRELAHCLKIDGFSSVKNAVGIDVK